MLSVSFIAIVIALYLVDLNVNRSTCGRDEIIMESRG